MGLLKLIKYSTFEVSVHKEIVDESMGKMNISGTDLTRLLYCVDWIDLT